MKPEMIAMVRVVTSEAGVDDACDGIPRDDRFEVVKSHEKREKPSMPESESKCGGDRREQSSCFQSPVSLEILKPIVPRGTPGA